MFINHILATEPELPAPGPYLYEYVIAGNGIFVRAKRPGLEAMIPLRACKINGLEPVAPYVNLVSRMPEKLLVTALRWSVEALPNEALFWYGLDADMQVWTIMRPRQIRTRTSVRPDDPHDEFGAQALIDLHSHNSMPPFFSTTDNKDETGFRIYAVVGSITPEVVDSWPALRVRVGIYGHFWTIPAARVFNLPPFLRDVEFSQPEPGPELEHEVAYE